MARAVPKVSRYQGYSDSTFYKVDRSLRFRSSASAYLSRTFGTPTNSSVFTFSCWAKRGSLDSDMLIFTGDAGGSGYDRIRINADNTISLVKAGVGAQFTSTALFRDTTAWYHIVYTSNGTSHNIYVNNVSIASGTATLSYFNTARTHYIGAGQAGANEKLDGYLSEINFIDGQALTPSSFGRQDTNGNWIPKKYTGTYGNNGFYLPFSNGSSTTTLGYDIAGITNLLLYSEDQTQANWTKGNMLAFGSGSVADAITAPDGTVTADKLIENTTATVQHYTVQTVTTDITQQLTFSVYAKIASGSRYLGLYLGNQSATANCVRAVYDLSNGTVTLTQNAGNGTGAYAEITSVGSGWYRCSIKGIPDTSGTIARCLVGFTDSPTNYLPTYTGDGSSGFYLWGAQLQVGFLREYLKTSTTNRTTGNDWTLTSFSLTAGPTYDWFLDTPTNNWSTINYTNKNTSLVVSNGGLDSTYSAAPALRTYSTIPQKTGLWYMEFSFATFAGCDIGIRVNDSSYTYGSSSNQWVGQLANGYAIRVDTGEKYNNNTFTSYGTAYTTSDILQMAVDCNTGKVWWGKNGTWIASGDPVAGTNPAFTFTPGVVDFCTSNFSNSIKYHNYGQAPLLSGATYYHYAGGYFKYAPPIGYKALCTENVGNISPKLDSNFDVLSWSGSASPIQVRKPGDNTKQFKPLLAFIKARNSAQNWKIFNALQGNAALSSNAASGESTISGVTLQQGGIDLPANTADISSTGVNYSGYFFYGPENSSVNTAGTIQSTVAVNKNIGVSVVNYTGTGANGTVGHGLDKTPDFIVIKARNLSTNWIARHSYMAATEHILFDSANGIVTGATTTWNSTLPNSTTFSLGSYSYVNNNTTLFTAFCFSEIPGFSKFGYYLGNGSNDGAVINCGFKPALVITKRIDAGYAWCACDTSFENPVNVSNKSQSISQAVVDVTTIYWDMLSNGFKWRSVQTTENTLDAVYMYMAFADNPFGDHFIYPSTAR